MEFFMAIALLCQVSSADKGGMTTGPYSYTEDRQLDCQQRYVHCVNTKSDGTYAEKLEKCIMEKK